MASTITENALACVILAMEEAMKEAEKMNEELGQEKPKTSFKDKVKSKFSFVKKDSKTKEDAKSDIAKESKEEVKETQKEEPKTKVVKEEVKDVKNEEIKETKVEEIKEEVKKEEIKEAIKVEAVEEPKVEVNVVDKVTMQNRSTCPVKVVTREEKAAQQAKLHTPSEVAKVEDEDHRVEHLLDHLKKINVEHTEPVRMGTGLYELSVKNNAGQMIPISVDINGLLYNEGIKFFFGKVLPGDEYTRPAIMMTNKSMKALKNGQEIPAKYVISEQLFNLNKILDLQTLKEKDPKKKFKTYEQAAKVLSDKEIYEGIVKAANGEPFRFAFAKYVSEDEFKLVSSKKNLASNLTNDKLLVSKEIWINVNKNDVKLDTKSYS